MKLVIIFSVCYAGFIVGYYYDKQHTLPLTKIETKYITNKTEIITRIVCTNLLILTNIYENNFNMEKESKVYVLYIKGPKQNPEGKFLAELLGQADTPGFFRIKLRSDNKNEEFIVNRQNLELDWIKQ